MHPVVASDMPPLVSVPCLAVLDMGRELVVGMVIADPTDQEYTSSFVRNCLVQVLGKVGDSV
eukprot:2514947-Rhodomonas_salina.1